MTMFIQTVTGALPVESVRIADAHAHVWIDPPSGVTPEARIDLHDYKRIYQEVMQFANAGGTLLVDCQPGGAGRDTRMLRRLSNDTGVRITAVTGVHIRKYYPVASWQWRANVDEAAQYFIDELMYGTRESLDISAEPIRAAVIKIGYEGVIEGQTQTLMEAAAVAAHQTGAAILFHTEQGRNAEALIPFYERHGIAPNRLYMCHVDKRPDIGLHRELAQAGVLLGYDTFGRPKYDPENGVWKLIPALAEAGLTHAIAVGQDFAFPSMWRSYEGEPGLTFLQSSIVPRLRAIGLNDDAIQQMTARNIAERLALTPR